MRDRDVDLCKDRQAYTYSQTAISERDRANKANPDTRFVAHMCEPIPGEAAHWHIKEVGK